MQRGHGNQQSSRVMTEKIKRTHHVYTLLVEVGRKEGDGLPEAATGGALMIYASGVDEPEAVRETVAILKQADLAPLDVTGYGSLEERLEEGHDITDDERDRRWRQLADLYLAQQLWFYPAEYVAEDSPAERILETVERFEEDLTDTTQIHAQLKAIVQVGDAIEVGTDRPERGLDDPLMVALKNAIKSMLESLASEVNQQARKDSSR